MNTNTNLVLSADQGLIVPLNRLLYIQAKDNASQLYIEGGRNLLEWKPLKYFNLMLSDQVGFLRIHRSYIVNRNYVVKSRANELQLTDGTVLPIGITYKEKTHQWILKPPENTDR